MLIVPCPVRILRTPYGTRRFINLFTRARHVFLSQAKSVHSTPSLSSSVRFISMLSFNLGLFPVLAGGSYPSCTSTRILCSFSACAIHLDHLARLGLITQIFGKKYTFLHLFVGRGCSCIVTTLVISYKAAKRIGYYNCELDSTYLRDIISS
jgi:hypothetical protein